MASGGTRMGRRLWLIIAAAVALGAAPAGQATLGGLLGGTGEDRVTIVAVAVAMWVGVALALLLDGR